MVGGGGAERTVNGGVVQHPGPACMARGRGQFGAGSASSAGFPEDVDVPGTPDAVDDPANLPPVALAGGNRDGLSQSQTPSPEARASSKQPPLGASSSLPDLL